MTGLVFAEPAIFGHTAVSNNRPIDDDNQQSFDKRVKFSVLFYEKTLVAQGEST